ncbi:transposase [Streptomyces sp. NRRL WC-3618]|uniref:transposase n=1 Tax=Streptomyces sp. NRRL WC-3618 TaxID=1519490 RepID=UPI0006AF4FC5|nr:transposase [Streptomyces sp. NRRL WC-3618]KOV70030.1 transposase [Streptomyces sp. NRRL WC-3618]
MTAAALDLSVGAALVLDEDEWQVERREPHTGRVHLVGHDGSRQCLTFRFLANHPRCRSSSRTIASGADRGRQPKSAGDLKPTQLELARLRFAHLMEINTGFRSGGPLKPGPGEPKPEYAPDTTTVTERRLAKVAELKAMNRQEAKLLALDKVSLSTLIRWERARRKDGLVGCADERWLRESGGHPSITAEVREAIHAVRQETLHGTKVSMRTRERKIRQYVREQFGDEVHVPSYPVLRRVWIEWFGSGRQRQRYARSAELPTQGGHVLIDRPGQVVALDTTVLPVMVRESVFGDAVKVHLTLALDVYTHSICAFRLTLVSHTSVDVAMLLRDVMLPLPMRDDWDEEMEWPYPGLPAAVVAEFAGHEVAGLPFFAPETVTTDHGSVYRNHHLVQVQQRLGCNILPARILRPTDKQAVERVFGSVRSLLFEQLPGYTGIDAADRGADPEGDAVLTIAEMEHLIATWVVGIWQTRRLGESAPHWDPGGDHSPNSLIAAAFDQGGFALEIPSPELYYEILPEHAVRKIDERHGVKIRGLWYDGPALAPYRGQRSSRGGTRQTKWIVHREPRDRRTVFFQDPLTHAWHPLRWTGLPPDGVVPAFGDKRVTELLQHVEQAGLRPRTDAGLLPHLLELMRAIHPVGRWRTRLTKSQRVEIAREREMGRTAAADRPTTSSPRNPSERPSSREHPVVATDTERRRKREAAVVGLLEPPPRLGEEVRRRNLFVLPPADDTETAR